MRDAPVDASDIHNNHHAQYRKRAQPSVPNPPFSFTKCRLFVGAIACGLLTDILGRKTVWQLSIFGVSIATLLLASSPNWKAVNVWTALCGLFGGGNCMYILLKERDQ
jgi:hypothetical protein